MREAEHILETRRWLKYASEDLHTAQVIIKEPTIAYRHVCWLAQQSAEKSIKAILIFLQIDFHRIHDLDALRNLIPEGWSVKAKFPDIAILTEWAVEARYPGNWQEANLSDATFAVKQAEDISDTVLSDFMIHELKIS
jgi:HEPN domain-containing protein